MTSFQLSVTPHRRAAARFVSDVHRKLQKAYADRPDITQSAIADLLGVHRSVINRQIRGHQDMSLSRVAELAWAMGLEPEFVLVRPEDAQEGNHPTESFGINPFVSRVQSSTAAEPVAMKDGNRVVVGANA